MTSDVANGVLTAPVGTITASSSKDLVRKAASYFYHCILVLALLCYVDGVLLADSARSRPELASDQFAGHALSMFV